MLEVRPTGEGSEKLSFHVRLRGEWNFLAWEAPTSKAPHGRLWLSDGDGLRAYEP